MSYAVYKEFNGKIETVHTETRKNKIESYFNILRRNFKKSNHSVIDVRQGYFQLPDYSADYWIGKVEETTKEKYVGKWYSFKICGTIVIIKVTGTVKAGEKYDGDSYIGKKTTIFKNGESLNEDWACYYKAFELKLKDKELKELKF